MIPKIYEKRWIEKPKKYIFNTFEKATKRSSFFGIRIFQIIVGGRTQSVSVFEISSFFYPYYLLCI